MLGSGSLIALSALIASLSTTTSAHTWIEEYQVIGPNGSYIGDRGYSRGYVARTDPTFNGDANILWLLPQLASTMPNGDVRLRINSSDSLCHPNQRTSNYTNSEYPMLKAAPGSYVAMKYLENGHVTLPWTQAGKPEKGGTVFVYGTTNPSNDEKIANVLKWTTDGTGGDGRGKLLATQNYDDGRCHQINDCVLSAERQVLYPNKIPAQPTSPGQEQWCESDLHIPTDAQSGKLTTYWVWQWPTAPNTECTYPEGKDEYYTTCADFEIEEAGANDVKIADEVATNTLSQENFQTQAVSTYSARTAVTSSRPIVLENWRRVEGSTLAVNKAWASSCGVSMATAIPDTTPPPSCPAGKWATGALFASVSSRVLAAAGTTPTGDIAPVTSAAAASMTPAPAAVPSSSPYIFTTTTIATVVTSVTISVTAAAPTVAANGIVENAYIGSCEGVAGEHVARHRRHARHF